MSPRALVLSIVVCVHPLSVGAQEGRGSFEHTPFTDLVVPEVDPDDRDSLAQALTEEGLRSFESGDHETAARQLEVSYRIHPTTEHLDVLGLALAALGHHRAAAERLERYLEADVSIDAERRARAERALRAARAHFAVVSVETDPSGASLGVDGEPVGTTPLQTPLLLDVGTHQLRARLDGHQDAVEEVDLEGGARVNLILRLQPIDAPRRRGLDVGLWTSIGFTIASAAVLVPSIVFAVIRTDELNDAPYPSSDMRRSAVSWRATSFAFAGLAGLSTVGAVVLGALRLRDSE